MVQKPKGRRHTQASNSGPIQPGTPLYRLLEMIARQIAARTDTTPMAASKGRKDRS